MERVCVAYIRVSSEEQSLHGVSLAAQEERLRGFAVGTDRKIADVVVDAGESAKSLKRPGIGQILGGVRAGRIGTVIILKLDRLTRSVRDLADLLDLFEKHSVALVSVCESLDTSTAAGRLMLNLLASVSQWEREAIGERTSFALSHKRRNGQAYGHTPFGFRRIRNALEVVPQEQAALLAARRMRSDGYTLAKIGQWLTQQGHTPHQGGKRWHRASVAQVLGSQMALEVPSV